MIVKTCAQCGEPFDAKSALRRFCSRRCATSSRLRPYWDQVSKGDGCWEWTSRRGTDGYGWAYLDGVQLGAHRAAWILTFGPIPDGMEVLHSCDNPPCVRPDHLELGTHHKNMSDASARGRMSIGERSPRASLTTERVIEIHRLRAEGLLIREIAVRVDAHPAAVRSVLRGRTWRHISWPLVETPSDSAA